MSVHFNGKIIINEPGFDAKGLRQARQAAEKHQPGFEAVPNVDILLMSSRNSGPGMFLFPKPKTLPDKLMWGALGAVAYLSDAFRDLFARKADIAHRTTGEVASIEDVNPTTREKTIRVQIWRQAGRFHWPTESWDDFLKRALELAQGPRQQN
jgi:hypothetical protein